MINPIVPPNIDANLSKQTLDRVMPDVLTLLNEIKNQLGGVLPEELSYGIVAGYLRGRGHTWPDSFLAMHRWISVMKGSYPEASKVIDGTMTIGSDVNGTINIQIKDKDGQDTL